MNELRELARNIGSVDELIQDMIGQKSILKSIAERKLYNEFKKQVPFVIMLNGEVVEMNESVFKKIRERANKKND